MKLFITLTVVCCFASAWAVALNDEQKAKGKVHFDHCVKQENVPEEDVKKLTQKDFDKPSESVKCFGACFLEQIDVLKDNKVQEDVAIQKLAPIIGEDKAKEVVVKCRDAKGPNRCETANEIFKCVSNFKDQILA